MPRFMESNTASQEIGETKGETDDALRMQNMTAACEAHPNGTVFQAVDANAG